MIPIITGVIASSIDSGLEVFAFSGQYECGGTTITAYATTAILTVNTVLYGDAALTQLYVDAWSNLFVYNFGGKAYTIAPVTSEVSSVYNTLFNDLIRYDGCGSSNTLGRIYTDPNGFQTNNTVYSSCYDDPANRLFSETLYVNFAGPGSANSIITTDGTGKITTIESCGT